MPFYCLFTVFIFSNSLTFNCPFCLTGFIALSGWNDKNDKIWRNRLRRIQHFNTVYHKIIIAFPYQYLACYRFQYDESYSKLYASLWRAVVGIICLSMTSRSLQSLLPIKSRIFIESHTDEGPQVKKPDPYFHHKKETTIEQSNYFLFSFYQLR